MALFHSFVFILLSFSTSVSQPLLVETHARRTIPDQSGFMVVPAHVSITGLENPIPTLTLQPGALTLQHGTYLKILPWDISGKEKILMLEDIGSDNHVITFKQVAPKPDPKSATINWSQQQLAEHIMKRLVEFRKPFSISAPEADGHYRVRIEDLVEPLIELKEGDKVKLDGKEGVVHMINSDGLLMKQNQKGRIAVSWEKLHHDIGDGKVQYKDNKEKWHQLAPVYELVKPTKTAVALWSSKKIRKYTEGNPDGKLSVEIRAAPAQPDPYGYGLRSIQNEGFVVIKGLAPPESELTLKIGDIFKILKSDDVNGEHDVLKLHAVAPITIAGVESAAHRGDMMFKQIGAPSRPDNLVTWPEQAFADQILQKHVYISKLSGHSKKWHLLNPSEMALKLKEHDADPLNPTNGFPKKHQIGHWPQHKHQKIRAYEGDNEKYRGVALLHYDDPDGKYGYYKSLCTGALITPPKGVNGHFVLTAAHCFWDDESPDPAHPDPNFKKWRRYIDKVSFQFGVSKQGKFPDHIAEDGADAVFHPVDCAIEKVMIPKEFTQFKKGPFSQYSFPDIAVVKLKEIKGRTPPEHPFELHEFKEEENIDEDDVEDDPNLSLTEFTMPGYGGRRGLEVTTLTMKQNKMDYGGVIECNGAVRGGDSGAPVLNADGKIVGVNKGGNTLPKVSDEPRNEKGGAVLPKLEEIQPHFTPITEERLGQINSMMKGDYHNAEVEIKTFGAGVAYYDDEQYEYYDDYSLFDKALDNLVSAQIEFKVAQRLRKMKRKSRRYYY